MADRNSVTSGTVWENTVGYSRAVRSGKFVEVSGTTAMDGDVLQHPDDVYGQTVFIMRKIEKALHALGARLEHVVRTRIYLVDITDWQEVGRAHGEFFHTIRPASSMLAVSALIRPDLRVEIEVSAIIPEGDVQG